MNLYPSYAENNEYERKMSKSTHAKNSLRMFIHKKFINKEYSKIKVNPPKITNVKLFLLQSS